MIITKIINIARIIKYNRDNINKINNNNKNKTATTTLFSEQVPRETCSSGWLCFFKAEAQQQQKV